MGHGGHVVVRRDLYTSKSANSVSGITSEVYPVYDAHSISLFLRGSPSTTTVQISNAIGSTVAIPETSWSVATVNLSPAPDMVDIEPGFRWMRCLRSETTEVVLNIRNRS